MAISWRADNCPRMDAGGGAGFIYLKVIKNRYTHILLSNHYIYFSSSVLWGTHLVSLTYGDSSIKNISSVVVREIQCIRRRKSLLQYGSVSMSMRKMVFIAQATMRRLRQACTRACAYAQSRLNLHNSNAISMA